MNAAKTKRNGLIRAVRPAVQYLSKDRNHFSIGRDNESVGSSYSNEITRELFGRAEEILTQPMLVEQTRFNQGTDAYQTI